ncbi:MAG: hypothetical protein WA323_08165, partial [Candidatus Nitrosopolaris sp.]
QKFSSRINGTLLEKIISSFILLLTNIRKIFTGIDSTGFKITHGRYRKQMKRDYSKLLYGQRNKNETIISVIKRFGDILHQDW